MSDPIVVPKIIEAQVDTKNFPPKFAIFKQEPNSSGLQLVVEYGYREEKYSYLSSIEGHNTKVIIENITQDRRMGLEGIKNHLKDYLEQNGANLKEEDKDKLQNIVDKIEDELNPKGTSLLRENIKLPDAVKEQPLLAQNTGGMPDTTQFVQNARTRSATTQIS
ncbi:MAG: hypothetical protein H6908_04890 [Hyphomicrobiales bacterium]|nr:hypothetical protein [Hyphomicrobiales bacterium]